jgi:hypothetical protein
MTSEAPVVALDRLRPGDGGWTENGTMGVNLELTNDG